MNFFVTKIVSLLLLLTLFWGGTLYAEGVPSDLHSTEYHSLPNHYEKPSKIIVAVFKSPENRRQLLELVDFKSILAENVQMDPSILWSFGTFQVKISKDDTSTGEFDFRFYETGDSPEKEFKWWSLPTYMNEDRAHWFFHSKYEYVIFLGITPHDVITSPGFLPPPLGPAPFRFLSSQLLISGHHLWKYDRKPYTKVRAEIIANHFRNEGLPILAFASVRTPEKYRRYIEPKLASHWYNETDNGRFQAIFETKQSVLTIALTGGYFKVCMQNSLWSALRAASVNSHIQQVIVKIPLEAVYAFAGPFPNDYNSLAHYYDQSRKIYNRLYLDFIEMLELKHEEYDLDGQVFHRKSSRVVQGDPVLGPYIEMTFSRQTQDR